MKKTISIIAVIALIIVGFTGYRYYKNTYVGEVGYAKVAAQSPAKEATKDDSGKTVTNMYSYHYQLNVVKEDGSHQVVPVEVTGENPTPLTPNSYVKVEFNSKRVLKGPNTVSKNQIPAKVMAGLDK